MEEGKSMEFPLLEHESHGRASTAQTLANIVVSVVGTGVLGLPYAFRIAGWLAGSIGVALAGAATYYCMLLLVKCRERLAQEEGDGTDRKTYGDLGHSSMGRAGRALAEALIFLSQCGGSVAYLVFIGQNLSAVLGPQRRHLAASPSLILLALVPVEIGLSWIGTLPGLAPFSVFADICNVLAMAIVVKEDLGGPGFSFRDRTAVTASVGGLPFAGGMAVFCFEGFGMTLALEGSMRDKGRFPRLLGQAFAGITLLYVLFGFCGYMDFGDETKDIVTLNLPRDWWALAVQIGMCLGLIFTFPIMVHPINEIIEGRLEKTKWFNITDDTTTTTTTRKLGTYVSRAILVIGLAILASCIPEFGAFASLVGSTVCALISFVLPAVFHLKIMGSSLSLWQRALDYVILSCGVLFAVYGTYNTIAGV